MKAPTNSRTVNRIKIINGILAVGVPIDGKSNVISQIKCRNKCPAIMLVVSWISKRE